MRGLTGLARLDWFVVHAVQMRPIALWLIDVRREDLDQYVKRRAFDKVEAGSEVVEHMARAIPGGPTGSLRGKP